MRKTAIVVGHTPDSPGACSPHNISCEFEFNLSVATELCINRGSGDIFLYDTYDQGYTSMVERNARDVNKGNYDLILELHYNAATPSANGCEALYHHKETEDFQEKEIGEKFCQLMEERLGFRNRGVKLLSNKQQRGYAAVYYPKGNCLILEPFFGSNTEDVERIREGFYDYVDIIEEIIKT